MKLNKLNDKTRENRQDIIGAPLTSRGLEGAL